MKNITLIREMLTAWEEQFGEGACDCQPEPQNEGNCCPWCRARALIAEDESGEDRIDESMDGDFDSAMASAGFGTDEDYGGGMESDLHDY